MDTQGKVLREVAPARITLPQSEHPEEVLSLRVALIRDLRRVVPLQQDQEDAALLHRWDADLEQTERQWWQEGWQATAALATQMTPKLIPIVTTASTCDALENAVAEERLRNKEIIFSLRDKKLRTKRTQTFLVSLLYLLSTFLAGSGANLLTTNPPNSVGWITIALASIVYIIATLITTLIVIEGV